jgi:AcrR family transcriptional regulator
MLRERILQTAVTLFTRYGIKGVSMDQIANEIGISKKTIYVEFESKEEVLFECINYEIQKMNGIMEKIVRNSSSALEIMVKLSTNTHSYFSSLCPSFIKDIRKFDKSCELLMDFNLKFKDRVRQHLVMGVEDEIFIRDLDYELISSLFVEQFRNVKSDYQYSVTMTFLKGICTYKGLKEMEQLHSMHIDEECQTEKLERYEKAIA